jgi:hypothetical protein
MQQGRRYRLKTATLGLTDIGHQRIALQIPANAIVTLTRPLLPGSNFVEVEWEHKTFALFALDMRDRGEPLNSWKEELSALAQTFSG